jgi:signal transduction histidine kinase
VSGEYLAEPPSPRLSAWFGERQWLAARVLAACAGWAVLTVAIGPHPHERGLRLFIGIVACGLIIPMRRWPLAILWTVAAATAVTVGSGVASLPLAFLLGLATYFAASRLPRRVSIWAALATAAVLGGALAYAAVAGGGAPHVVQAVVSFTPLAAGWLAGDATATRRRYQAGLAEQAERERAAEAARARQEVCEERVRIARELHDVVAHTLAVITVQAGVGRRLMARRPQEAALALESIEAIGRTAQEELRVVLGLLRDDGAGPAALAPAPRLADVEELAATVRASGTPVELRIRGLDRGLSPALELSVYRVVQEALTNVVKHAPGARATVDLAVCDRMVRVEVTDDGGAAGQPAGTGRPAGPGHGIVGMRERTGAFGGWLVAEPLPGRGFHVLTEIPLVGAA